MGEIEKKNFDKNYESVGKLTQKRTFKMRNIILHFSGKKCWAGP